MKKIYIWLIFTVLIGLLPIIARITAVNIFMLKDVVTISPVDIIRSLGLCCTKIS